MKSAARLATLTVILLVPALAAFAGIVAQLDFRYRGAELPAENRQLLERTLRQELRPARPVRMVVTITDRVVATR